MQWEGEQGLFFAGLGPSGGGGGGVKRRQETTMDASGGAHLHQPAQTSGTSGDDRRQNPFEETRNPVDQTQQQQQLDVAARQNPFRESDDDGGGDDVEDPFAGCAPAPAAVASRDDPFGAMVQGGGIDNSSLPPMSLPSQSQSQPRTLAQNSNERRNLLGGWMTFGGGGGATSATAPAESSNVPSVVVPSGEGDFDEREVLSKRSNIIHRRIMRVHDPSKAGDGGTIATMMAEEEAGEGDIDERQIMSKRSNILQRRIGRVHHPMNAGGGGAIAIMMAEEGDTATEAPLPPRESMRQNSGVGGGNAPETDFLDFGDARETREDRASGGNSETIVAANAGGGGFGPLTSLRDEALAPSTRRNPPAAGDSGVANGDRPLSPRGEGDFDEREILSKRSNIIQRRITMRDPASHAGGAIAMMMAEAKDDDGGEGGDPFDTANGPRGQSRRKGRRRRPSLESLVPSPLVMKKKAPSTRRSSDPALAGGSQSGVDYGDEDWLGGPPQGAAGGAAANREASPPDWMGEALPSNGNEPPQIRTASDSVDPGDPDGTLANDDDERGAKKPPNNKPKRLRPRKNFEKHIGRRVSFLSPGKEGAGASRRDGVNAASGGREENVAPDAVAAVAEATEGGDSEDLLGFDAALEDGNGVAPTLRTSSCQNDELLTLSMLDSTAAADAAAATAAYIPEQRSEERAGSQTGGDEASLALYDVHHRGSQPQSNSDKRQLEAELDNAVGCFRNLAQFADASNSDANAPEEGASASVREDILNSNLLTDEEKRALMQDMDGDDLDDYRRNGDEEDDDDSLEDLAAFGRESVEDCDRGEEDRSHRPNAFEQFGGEPQEGTRSGIPSPVMAEGGEPMSNANIDLDPRAQDSSLLENERTVTKHDEEYNDLLDFGTEERGEGAGEGEGDGVGVAGPWDGADADRRPPSENVASDAVDGGGAAAAAPSLTDPSDGFGQNDVSAVDDLLLDFVDIDGGDDAGQLNAWLARSSSLLEDFEGMGGGGPLASASVRDDTTAGAAPGETVDLDPPEADSRGDRDFVPKAAAAAEPVAEDEGARTNNEKEEAAMDEAEAVSSSDGGTSRKASRWWGGRRSAAAKSSAAAAAAAATAQSSSAPDAATAAAAAAEDEAAERQQPRGGRFARRLFRRSRADSRANRDESAVSAREGTSGEDGAANASTAVAAAAEEEVDDPLAYVPPATLMGAAEVASDDSPRVRRGSGGGTYVLEPVMEGSEYSAEFEEEGGGDVKMGATATFVNSLPGGMGARLDFGSSRRNEDEFDDDDESRDADGTIESMSIATESRYPEQLLGVGETFDNGGAADYEKVPLSDAAAASPDEERGARSQRREDSASSFETIPTKPDAVERSSSSRSGDIEEDLGGEEDLYSKTRDVDSGIGESRSRRQRRSLFGKKKFRSEKSAYKQIEGEEERAGPSTAAARVVTAAELTAAREESYRDAELGNEEITTSIIEGGKAKSLAKKPPRWSKGRRIYCCCCILFNLAGAAASLGIIYGMPFFEDVIATVDIMLSGDTDGPTAAPSISAAPSTSPVPSATVSSSPSIVPSSPPTVSPTAAPSSRAPTAAPSPLPTRLPTTQQPTATRSASASPSVGPTSYSEWPKPNVAPPLRRTPFPAAAPSQSPSFSPSDEREGPFAPTREPSQSNATIPPTANRTPRSPSQHPASVSPTVYPSSSSQPTPVPTAVPTAAPTTAPIAAESFAPDRWSLLGSALKGADGGNMFGYAVSLSSDGSRLAVGSRRDSGGGVENRGSVTILDYVEEGFDGARTNRGGRWTEVAKLQGAARGDQFGSALTLSGDGRRLAVGALGNDDNGDNSGKIQIYEQSRDVNGAWNVVAEFSGEAPGSLLGLSVSLDRAGTVLAAGAPEYGTDEESDRMGRVYVYAEDDDDDDGSWNRLGPPLDGTRHKELFGWSVSVARAEYGIVVAVGSPMDTDRTDEHGHVDVFGYDTSFSNGEEQEWAPLNAEPFSRGTPGDRFGHSVSLSQDGRRVAIGSPGGGSTNARGAIDNTGLACMYEADQNTSQWKQVGSDVHGDAPGDELGYAVALSADGLVLAAGAPRHRRANGNGNDDDRVSGRVHVYEQQRPKSESGLDGEWARLKEDVISGREGEDLGFSLAIADASSSDRAARIIAAGAPDAGVVRVFG